MSLFSILHHSVKFVELAAAITGFLYWRKLRGTPFQWFPVYLAVIAACEFMAFFAKLYGIPGSNQMFAWFVIPLEFLFFHYLYFSHFEQNGKKVVLACTALYIASWFAEYVFLGKINSFFMSLSYSVGNITLLVLAIMYFSWLMRSDRIVFFYNEIFFWINIGLLLFYLGSFPYYGLFNFLALNYYSFFLDLSLVQVVLNNIMYGLFIFGFICGKRK